MTLNLIYASLFNQKIVYILHILTTFIGVSNYVLLFMFNLILYKTELIITKKKQMLILILYNSFLILAFFIPNAIEIGPATSWRPKWSFSFILYLLIFLSVFVTIPSIYFLFKILSTLSEISLRKRWRLFIMGNFGYYIVLYSTLFFNFLADPKFSILYFLIGLLLYPSCLLLYFGIGNKI
ncbi:MAG: hypothetical protein ACP6IY_11340 [Promethearchaeia archaeon]